MSLINKPNKIYKITTHYTQYKIIFTTLHFKLMNEYISFSTCN